MIARVLGFDFHGAWTMLLGGRAQLLSDRVKLLGGTEQLMSSCSAVIARVLVICSSTTCSTVSGVVHRQKNTRSSSSFFSCLYAVSGNLKDFCRCAARQSCHTETSCSRNVDDSFQAFDRISESSIPNF